MATLFYGAVAGVAVLGAAWTSAGVRLLTRAPLARPCPWWVAGLAAGAGLVAATRLAEHLWPALRRLGSELAKLVGPCHWPRVLALAGLSGLAEEALFRGPVQDFAGLWLTAALFAGLHGGGRRELWSWTVFALVAGVVFGALAQVYASPWPAAVAHVLVNALNLRRLRHYQREAS